MFNYLYVNNLFLMPFGKYSKKKYFFLINFLPGCPLSSRHSLNPFIDAMSFFSPKKNSRIYEKLPVAITN